MYNLTIPGYKNIFLDKLKPFGGKLLFECSYSEKEIHISKTCLKWPLKNRKKQRSLVIA